MSFFVPPHLGRAVLAHDPVGGRRNLSIFGGLHPDRVIHIREGSGFLGNSAPALIDQVGGNSALR